MPSIIQFLCIFYDSGVTAGQVSRVISSFVSPAQHHHHQQCHSLSIMQLATFSISWLPVLHCRYTQLHSSFFFLPSYSFPVNRSVGNLQCPFYMETIVFADPGARVHQQSLLACCQSPPTCPWHEHGQLVVSFTVSASSLGSQFCSNCRLLLTTFAFSSVVSDNFDANHCWMRPLLPNICKFKYAIVL